MSVIKNILSSGHQFSETDNLLKFRFALLNILMLVATFFNAVNYLASCFGVIDLGDAFEKSILLQGIASVFIIFVLRRNKSYYHYAVIFFICTSLILFYFVLLTRKEDEFRLITFFMVLFVTYILMGKNIGVLLSLFILLSILYIQANYDLGFSSIAYSTFFNFFIIFTGFLYFFLSKVERDALEFEVLNNKLKENIKQETQQRMEQEQILLRQCRMANMGQMIDSIAHQWRQPLMHINSILLNMETSLETKNEKVQTDDYLENKIDEVAKLTSHMSQTIEDFRGLFSVEREDSNFIIQDVIDDALALMKNNLNDIELKQPAEDHVSVLGHRSELMQVMIILIGNAIEALKNRKIENKIITISVKTSDKSVLISIEDNAGGISPETIDVMFDPYFTTKEQSGGTGLGLYIAKIIVEHNMDGRITASNTSTGAIFSFSLIRAPFN